MNQLRAGLLALVALALLMGASGIFYTVNETEQAIITQFGRPVGDSTTAPGLHMKVPFIQRVNRIERRILEWDGLPNEMPTRDKLYILVDTFGRWRIADPLQYFLRLRDERSAQSRLDDILGSETRNAVAKHDLIEIIRTTKGRKPAQSDALEDSAEAVGKLQPIRKGRIRIEEEIFTNAASKLKDFGIELLDIRFKRINYNEQVRTKIYERMVSERQRMAARFRSQGEGEAARILGKKEREVRLIRSEAYRKIQTIQGDADAKATTIYAEAYGQSAESKRFYEFMKTLETYEAALGEDTTVVLTTDSDLFSLFEGDDAAAR